MKVLLLITFFLSTSLQANSLILALQDIRHKNGDLIGEIRLVEYEDIVELRGSLSELESNTRYKVFIHEKDICRGNFDSQASVNLKYEEDGLYLLDEFISGFDGYYSFEYQNDEISFNNQQYFIVGRSFILADANSNQLACVVID